MLAKKRPRETAPRTPLGRQVLPYLTILAGLTLAYASIFPLLYIEGSFEAKESFARLHQCHFAQAACALVGIQHLVQHFGPARRFGLDDAAAFEAHLNIVDQRALMRERLGARHMAFDAQRMRRGEDLFGRDVRVAGNAILRRRCAAMPFVAVGKPDRQIRARSGEVQGREALAVQPCRTLGEVAVVSTGTTDYQLTNISNAYPMWERDGIPTSVSIGRGSDLLSRPSANLPILMATLAVYAVSITAVCISVYLATRQIIVPLTKVGEMADRMWREEGDFDRTQASGVKAAEDLAEMYYAVNSRVDQRLQLLTSFAHDVRLPIERLRHRSSTARSGHERKLLTDLAEIEQLIDDGIAYATQGHLIDENLVLLEIEHFLCEMVEGYAETGRNVCLTASVAARVLIKKTAIKRIVGNFIDNGLKFAGAVEVRSSYLPSGEVSIAVLDRGPGVDDDELDKIVQPFIRSKKNLASTPGVGLGLAIAHQLAQTSNARIKLSNRLGGGLIAAVVVKCAGFDEAREVVPAISDDVESRVVFADS